MHGLQCAAGLMFLASFHSHPALADDHGNTRETASGFPIPSIVHGTLETGGDVDYFHIVVPQDTWYGTVVFDGQTGDIKTSLENEYGENAGFNMMSVFFHIWWGEGWPVRTNYFRVEHSDWYSGDGGETYHMASFQFPSAASAVDTLYTFNLDPSQPLDARTFNISPGLYAFAVVSMDPDVWESPQFTYWETYPSGDDSSWGTGDHMAANERVGLEYISDTGFMHTVTHFPDWNVISPAGVNVALRLQPCVPAPMVDGQGTGRIETDYEIDVWSIDLDENTEYGLWLTDPDGKIMTFDGYDVGAFALYEGYPGRYGGSPNGMFTFNTFDQTNFAVTVFSSEAKLEDYTVHVQSFTDDYGRWEGDTPPPGEALLNASNTGEIEVPPDEDAFTFNAVAGKTYSLWIADDELFSAQMYGDWNWPEMSFYGDSFTAPDNGTCQVEVRAGWNYQVGSGTYSFVVSEFVDDADNSPEEAIPLTLDSAVNNDLKAPGDMDWFVFEMNNGVSYEVTCGTGREILVYFQNRWYSYSTTAASIDFDAEYTGPCYFAIRAAPATGTYSVIVSEAGGGGGDDYQDWAAGYDLGELDGPDDDADGDGFSNNEERIAGTNPTQSGDLFRASSAVSSGNGAELILGDALPGRVYSVRYTNNLMLPLNVWSTAAVNIDHGKIVVSINPTSPGTVYRLIVSLP
jgi:hypothetical protein